MKVKFSNKKSDNDCKVCNKTIEEQKNCELCNCKKCAQKTALDTILASKAKVHNLKPKRNCDICNCKCSPKLCGAPRPIPDDDSCSFCHSAWWKRWMRS